MLLRKTLSMILITIIFMGSIVRIQGSTPVYNYNDKDIIVALSSKSTIKDTSKRIVLDHSEITMASGQTIQLKAKIEPETKSSTEKSKFVWKSDNSSSVQVDAKGYIKAIKPDSKAVITVSSSDKKLKVSCKVTVISKKDAEGCVAIINNTKITNQEYIMHSKFNMSQFLASNSINNTTDKYNWTTKINGKTAKEQVKKVTLDNIHEIKIELIKAKEAGIKLNSDDIKLIDNNFNQIIKESGSREAAEKEVKAYYGINLSEYKEAYTDMVLAQKYISSEFSKTTVSDNEVQKYYTSNIKDFAKVTVTHILLSTIDNKGVAISTDQKAEVKEKAEKLLARVAAGKNIKILAVKNSEDPAVKDNNGEYTFGKGEMVTEFEEWAFSHSVGDTGLVETSYGYHVMKLEKHAEIPFDDVKEKIKAFLVELKFSNDFKKKLDSWRKEAQFGIQINNKTIEKVDKSLYGV